MRDYKEKHWKLIYDDLFTNYPNVEENISTWYPSGQWSITVRMKNGNKFKYNMLTKEFFRIYDYCEDGFPDEDNWRKSFAVSLVNQLASNGMSQKDLAYKTEISEAAITKYVLGYSTPSVYNLSKIIHALGCTYEDLVEFEF